MSSSSFVVGVVVGSLSFVNWLPRSWLARARVQGRSALTAEERPALAFLPDFLSDKTDLHFTWYHTKGRVVLPKFFVYKGDYTQFGVLTGQLPTCRGVAATPQGMGSCWFWRGARGLGGGALGGGGGRE